jgi:hypothetical protein
MTIYFLQPEHLNLKFIEEEAEKYSNIELNKIFYKSADFEPVLKNLKEKHSGIKHCALPSILCFLENPKDYKIFK